MALFIKSGTTYRVTDKESMDLHELLPVGNYKVAVDMHGNYFLEKIESFELPSKLYGNTTRHTQRIVNSFWDRPAQTGVLLNGEKGSGKTLLAKNVSVELAKAGVPTIVINNELYNEGFFKLLQDIDQPCVVLFDEFEKVYDREGQERILTLLDGVFSSKKLYILTVNDKWKVNDHMRNRPGRLFYLLDFKGLDAVFIREYCEDKLNNKQYIEQICSLASLYQEFNFDMLKALVEEMNRYNESPSEALEMLNAKPEYDRGAQYNVTITHNGNLVEVVDEKIWQGNPLATKGVSVSFDPAPEDNDAEWCYFTFTPDHLINLDAKAGVFTYESNGDKLTLTKVKDAPLYDYSKLY